MKFGSSDQHALLVTCFGGEFVHQVLIQSFLTTVGPFVYSANYLPAPSYRQTVPIPHRRPPGRKVFVEGLKLGLDLDELGTRAGEGVSYTLDGIRSTKIAAIFIAAAATTTIHRQAGPGIS